MHDYLQTIGLPNPPIKAGEAISNAFLQVNIFSLWDAISYIKKLPYGRTQNHYCPIKNA